jgi:hypothetical protein
LLTISSHHRLVVANRKVELIDIKEWLEKKKKDIEDQLTVVDEQLATLKMKRRTNVCKCKKDYQFFQYDDLESVLV